MKLDFLVAGFGKCGTTSLCAVLSEHPEVYIPVEKEPCFFAFNHYRGWPWYERFFRNARPSQLRGEGSQFYSAEKFEVESCRRIHEYFPQARLIFIARHPIARLESYYREMHHSGHIINAHAPYTIGRTLAAFPNLVQDTFYWQRINTYRRHFPDDQIHVLFLEDLARRPAAELAQCFEFLGVDPSIEVGGGRTRLNAGSTKLHDSKLMRYIREHERSNRYWKKMPVAWQNRLGRATGLRKPFRGPVVWEDGLRDRMLETLGEDARRFLAFYGKPADFWGEIPGGQARSAAA